MTIIPHTQMVLGRERKQLGGALANRDWAAVKQGDADLMAALSQATDDPNKDMATLLRELREVVALYRDIINQCDVSVQALTIPDNR
jgi:isocitrate/isopropylmalate dehydrogenase